MAKQNFTSLANAILTNYGQLLVQAFTEAGQDPMGIIAPNSAMGRIRDWGNIHIGNGEVQEDKAFDWGVDTAAQTAVSYGANTTYSADTAEVFAAAALDWKRVGVPLSWDDLLATGSIPIRGGANALNYSFVKRLKALVTKIESMIFLDGTGNGSLDLTGLAASLSASNTYAGINQVGNTYWQAGVVVAGAALAKSHLKSLIGDVWDKERMTPGSHEMWMPRGIWEQYVALYIPKVSTTQAESGGDMVAQIYMDGQVEVPIHVIPGMVSTEIWLLNKEQIHLNFKSQSASHSIPVDNVSEVIHQGIPIGMKEVPETTDTTSIWLRAWPQLANFDPRTSAVVTTIT